MTDQMTNTGSQESADAIVEWASPLAIGTVFMAREKGTELWTTVIELLDLPGAVAVGPGDSVEYLGDGAFRKCESSANE